MSDLRNCWEIELQPISGIALELTIPHDVLEWFVNARDASRGTEIWSDWMDYSGYVPKKLENREALLQDMARDIEIFVARAATATGFRVDTERTLVILSRSVAYWEIGGRWVPVSLARSAADEGTLRG